MAVPSDLVAHYSSQAFHARAYGLTAVGAVLAATIQWIKGVDESNGVGTLLILIVASLAEGNRRYTFAYICACYAASICRRTDPPEIKAQAASWKRFRLANERPWSTYVGRFVLSWSTYIPGLVVGIYLILRGGKPTALGWIGLGIAALTVLWWFVAPTIRIQLRRPRRARAGGAGAAIPHNEREITAARSRGSNLGLSSIRARQPKSGVLDFQAARGAEQGELGPGAGPDQGMSKV